MYFFFFFFIECLVYLFFCLLFSSCLNGSYPDGYIRLRIRNRKHAWGGIGRRWVVDEWSCKKYFFSLEPSRGVASRTIEKRERKWNGDRFKGVVGRKISLLERVPRNHAFVSYLFINFFDLSFFPFFLLFVLIVKMQSMKFGSQARLRYRTSSTVLRQTTEIFYFCSFLDLQKYVHLFFYCDVEVEWETVSN